MVTVSEKIRFGKVYVKDSLLLKLVSWSPIQIPDEWNNYIVLLCVVFGVTNASYRRKTGNSFIADVLSFGLSHSLYKGDQQRPTFLDKGWQERLDDLAAIATTSAVIFVIALLPAYCFLLFMSFFISIQIAPRHPSTQHIKYRVHDLSIVRPRTLAVLRHQRLKQSPFVITQIESHDPPTAAVNHVPPCFSISYLGTDPNRKPPRFSNMARIIFSRFPSKPVVVRWGVP